MSAYGTAATATNLIMPHRRHFARPRGARSVRVPALRGYSGARRGRPQYSRCEPSAKPDGVECAYGEGIGSDGLGRGLHRRVRAVRQGKLTPPRRRLDRPGTLAPRREAPHQGYAPVKQSWGGLCGAARRTADVKPRFCHALDRTMRAPVRAGADRPGPRRVKRSTATLVASALPPRARVPPDPNTLTSRRHLGQECSMV